MPAWRQEPCSLRRADACVSGPAGLSMASSYEQNSSAAGDFSQVCVSGFARRCVFLVGARP
jgi:hypothetical protein